MGPGLLNPDYAGPQAPVHGEPITWPHILFVWLVGFKQHKGQYENVGKDFQYVPLVVLASLSQLAKLESPGKREAQERNYLCQVGLWAYLWGIFLLAE